jgi:uncharacterized protein with PQ loop repeat
MNTNQMKDKMLMQYFPEITDWTVSYPEYSECKDWHKLSSMIFIFFHPTGTKWTVWGTLLLANIMFISVPLLFHFNPFSILISGVVLFYIWKFASLALKLMKKKRTLYEMYLRRTK